MTFKSLLIRRPQVAVPRDGDRYSVEWRTIQSASLAIGITFAVSHSAHADPITTLYNSGVDSGGIELSAGFTDPHWTGADINPSNSVETRGIALTTQGGTVNGSTASGPLYWYNPGAWPIKFETSFSLASDETSTTLITGRVYSNGVGGTINLNGGAVGAIAGGGTWSTFVISSDFLTGSNLLSFAVNTPASAQEYFDVELAGTVGAVAEPAMSLTIVLAGLWLASSRNRRDRRSVAGVAA